MKVCVVGLGEIGSAVYDELEKIRSNEVWGVDKNSKQCKGKQAQTELMDADVYCICVYTTEQVLDVCKHIEGLAKDPLIIVESTVERGTWKKIEDIFDGNVDLVVFPHRFNPGDADHKVFNLDRIAGVNREKAWDKFISFINGYHQASLHRTTPEIAEIAKPIENAIRYLEIALAEDLKIACHKAGIDFKELRTAINTKWNIDLKEARDGIGGKCLPKDADITLKMLDSRLIKEAVEVDKEYRKSK